MARQVIPDITEQANARPGSRRAPERSLAANLILSLRPLQWTKNLIIFAALMFGQKLLEPRAIAYALAAFAIFASFPASFI